MALKTIIYLGFVALALGAVFEPSKPTEGAALIEPPVEVGLNDPLQPIQIRKSRSADGGSANVDIHHDDKSGTTGTVSGNQNVWSSPDNSVQVDVHGSASKNFDHGDKSGNVGVGIKW